MMHTSDLDPHKTCKRRLFDRLSDPHDAHKRSWPTIIKHANLDYLTEIRMLFGVLAGLFFSERLPMAAACLGSGARHTASRRCNFAQFSLSFSHFSLSLLSLSLCFRSLSPVFETHFRCTGSRKYMTATFKYMIAKKFMVEETASKFVFVVRF